MKQILYILTFFLSTFAMAQENSVQQMAEAFAGGETFRNASVGIKVITGNGKIIADVCSEKLLAPASNMKLISTGTALAKLGKDYRYSTDIAYDGIIQDGILHGNLYIVGNGDPLIGSKDSLAIPLEKTFREWERIVRNAGIRNIDGHIIGDGRWLDGMPEEPTWQWNDIGTYYGTGATGLMFYENMQSFSVSAGSEVGSPVNISPSYPNVPWMTFIYDCTTGKAGTGDQLYMYTCDLAPTAVIRGTFGVDRSAKRLDCANKFPELTCAHYFCEYLNRRGLRCTKGAADFKLKTEWMTNEIDSKELSYIGSTFSPTLDRIAFETNHASNNLYAEALFRSLGREMHGSACYDSSYVAMNEVLEDLKLNTSKGIKIQDGSGLSRQNYVSPDFFCSFLQAMMSSECFSDFISSLPSPGGNGTMQYNMKGQAASLRNRIKVKSGSMNGTRCYTGYILPSEYNTYTKDRFSELPDEVKNKTIVFSIMTNNCTSPTWKVRPLLDKIMIVLAEGN